MKSLLSLVLLAAMCFTGCSVSGEINGKPGCPSCGRGCQCVNCPTDCGANCDCGCKDEVSK